MACGNYVPIKKMILFGDSDYEFFAKKFMIIFW